MHLHLGHPQTNQKSRTLSKFVSLETKQMNCFILTQYGYRGMRIRNYIKESHTSVPVQYNYLWTSMIVYTKSFQFYYINFKIFKNIYKLAQCLATYKLKT